MKALSNFFLILSLLQVSCGRDDEDDKLSIEDFMTETVQDDSDRTEIHPSVIDFIQYGVTLTLGDDGAAYAVFSDQYLKILGPQDSVYSGSLPSTSSKIGSNGRVVPQKLHVSASELHTGYGNTPTFKANDGSYGYVLIDGEGVDARAGAGMGTKNYFGNRFGLYSYESSTNTTIEIFPNNNDDAYEISDIVATVSDQIVFCFEFNESDSVNSSPIFNPSYANGYGVLSSDGGVEYFEEAGMTECELVYGRDNKVYFYNGSQWKVSGSDEISFLEIDLDYSPDSYDLFVNESGHFYTIISGVPNFSTDGINWSTVNIVSNSTVSHIIEFDNYIVAMHHDRDHLTVTPLSEAISSD